MNGKIVKLEYISPRCAVCGRDLPKERRKKCYYCLPPRAFRCGVKPAATEEDKREYTLSERAAQADAYGISYGKLMAIVENGLPMPPRIRSVRWPLGSAHWGEEQ